jgi:membrane fusion protein (multidrug efflux system)
LFYLSGGRYVSTDDAYIRASKLMVSTDVSGIVSSVDVHEGQLVKAGDVLFRLSPKQFQIALDNAKAKFGADRAEYPRHEAGLRADAE